MGYFKPKSCCGCFTVREGAIILLVLSLIGNALNLFLYLAMFDQLNKINDYKISDTMRIVNIITSLIGLLFVILGLIGVLKRKPKCIHIYIYFYVLQWFYNLFGSFINIGSSPIVDITKNVTTVIVGIIAFIIGSIITFYFVFVFNAYAKQLENEQKEENEIAAAAAKV